MSSKQQDEDAKKRAEEGKKRAEEEAKEREQRDKEALEQQPGEDELEPAEPQTLVGDVPPAEKVSDEMTKQPWQTEPRQDEEETATERAANEQQQGHTRRAGTLVPSGVADSVSAELASSQESRQKVQEARRNLSTNYAPHPDPDLEAGKRG